MRKVALLLASLGIMTAAYAEQPKLTVTHVGQEIEIENQAGAADYDEVNLYNNVGLAYGDWTFALQAGKQWEVNFEDDDYAHSKNHRFQMDVWKKINDDLKLGLRFRGTNSYDRYYARWDWKHGMLWSSGDVWYESKNGLHDDQVKSEFFPIGVQYGPVKVGYFINYNWTVGDVNAGQEENYFEHQIRAYATLYKGEKLTVTTEGRFTLGSDYEYKEYANGNKKEYKTYDDFGRIRVYLGGSYQVNENLSVYGNYGYEFRDWKYEDGMTEASDLRTAKNYQDIIVGWKYTF